MILHIPQTSISQSFPKDNCSQQYHFIHRLLLLTLLIYLLPISKILLRYRITYLKEQWKEITRRNQLIWNHLKLTQLSQFLVYFLKKCLSNSQYHQVYLLWMLSKLCSLLKIMQSIYMEMIAMATMKMEMMMEKLKIKIAHRNWTWEFKHWIWN